MTGRDLIILIMSNHLEDEEVLWTKKKQRLSLKWVQIQ